MHSQFSVKVLLSASSIAILTLVSGAVPEVGFGSYTPQSFLAILVLFAAASFVFPNYFSLYDVKKNVCRQVGKETDGCFNSETHLIIF